MKFHPSSAGIPLPQPQGCFFRDDLELPRHRRFAQLRKLVHGRRFELAPPTESRQNSSRFERRFELCILPSLPRQALAGHRPLVMALCRRGEFKTTPMREFWELSEPPVPWQS